MRIKTKWIAKERALHKRAMRAPQILETEQARRYAAYLLAREGVSAEPDDIEILFNPVRINGRNVRRAWQYRHNRTVYDFPNREFTPAEPICDEAA